MDVVCIITVCVDYSDYLKYTLPVMCRFGDRVVVVTTSDDLSTQKVVADNAGVELICMNREMLYLDGSTFNKSLFVRTAQEHVHKRFPHSWVLVLDADVMLVPKNRDALAVRQSILRQCVDKTCMYTIDRFTFGKKKEFDERGYDLTNGVYGGYYGAGYFQLYFDKCKFYAMNSRDCSECDVIFASSFSAIVKLYGSVAHFGEEGKNWEGRKSDRW